MAQQIQTTQLVALPINYGQPKIPPEGPAVVKIILDFSAGQDPTKVLRLQDLFQTGRISAVQSIYIDASGSPNSVSVQSDNPGFSQTVTGGSQGYYPFFATAQTTLTFTGTATGTNMATIGICNVPVTSVNYQASAGLNSFTFNVDGYAEVIDIDAVALLTTIDADTSIIAGAIGGGVMSVSDSDTHTALGTANGYLATLAGSITAGVQAVSDAALEALITGGKLAVVDATGNGYLATLAGSITAGVQAVADATLDGIVSSSALTVYDIAGSTNPTTADVTVAATTTTQLLGANANRKEAWVSNNSTSAIARIGDSSTGAARGFALQPGAVAIIDSKAAIYAYNPSGAGITFGLMEVVR